MHFSMGFKYSVSSFQSTQVVCDCRFPFDVLIGMSGVYIIAIKMYYVLFCYTECKKKEKS